VPDAIVVIEQPTEVKVVATPTQVKLAAEGPRGIRGLTGPIGPQGLQGPPGLTDTFVHNQTTPLVTWDIVHNMGLFPSVVVVDSAGTVVLGDIEYISDSELILTFAAPFGGTAYLM
jgi:hypothetical protein